MFNSKTILITGGTGSFGRKCVEIILKKYSPEKLIIFSRDELKQFEMSQIFDQRMYPCIRYFLGDVRDSERLTRAFAGVDYVIHAAALKQVPAAEYNPFEAVKTNVIGAQNVINAAIDANVKRVIALSTDKAANPVNLYGATKLCSDKLFIAGNSYSGYHETRFSVVRYGNVVGSRGSVVPYFKMLKSTGVIPITDPKMTRFWITLKEGVEFVLKCFDLSVGGEFFVPKIPSMNIMDLAVAIAPDCEHKIIGIRPGEKIHEVMITEDDARHTLEFDGYFIVEPEFKWWSAARHVSNGGKAVSEGFRYASNTNDQWISVEDLRKIIEE
ncbi:MAG: UDP-N-acetylglucosamine 4,6-dehydratase (inverting) [Nitrospirae bacterium]|nr:UDP-N-acetylglucosamine 4,6-dehydratase (inverting) [Nitrospirota bacterium]